MIGLLGFIYKLSGKYALLLLLSLTIVCFILILFVWHGRGFEGLISLIFTLSAIVGIVIAIVRSRTHR